MKTNKLLLIIALLSFTALAQAQTLILQTGKIPEFTGDISKFPYVENSETHSSGFKSAKFSYVKEPYTLAQEMYYLCYYKEEKKEEKPKDENCKCPQLKAKEPEGKWVVFAVYLHHYKLWHINSKFKHLLTF